MYGIAPLAIACMLAAGCGENIVGQLAYGSRGRARGTGGHVDPGLVV